MYLPWELKKLWDIMTVIPIADGAFGTVSKDEEKKKRDHSDNTVIIRRCTYKSFKNMRRLAVTPSSLKTTC